jgi:hypothetical protein
LNSDFYQSTKLPVQYDSDLENFWTQKSMIFFITISKNQIHLFT